VEGKKEKVRDYITSIFKSYAWVRTNDYVLIRKTDGTDAKLYDIRNDPDHLHDISSESPAKVEELWSLAIADAGGDFPELDISFPLWDSKK
jgi:arylsulfatase A-like enzyme